MAKVVYLKEVRRQSGGWLGGFRTRVAVLLTVGLLFLAFLFAGFRFPPYL
jgi:hypothetical protein